MKMSIEPAPREDRARSSTGDEGRFERLFRDHHQAVVAYCVRRTGPADGLDAAAEVFLVAWRRLVSVPKVSEEELPWLFGVAYRVVSNQRRSNRRRLALEEKVVGTSAAELSRQDEPHILSPATQEVMDALGRLRPLDREVITLTIWEEMSPAEIAAALEISREAVDQRYSRAKRRLARELGYRAEPHHHFALRARKEGPR